MRLAMALVVVLHHSTPLRFGTFAVAIFFILSGFWITRMWDERYCKLVMAPLAFVVSRWMRLAPLILTTGIIYLIVSLSFREASGIKELREPISSWLLHQSLILTSASVTRLNPPIWSLDLEARFYVTMVIALVLLRRKSIPQKPVFCVLLAASVVMTIATVMQFGLSDNPDILAWFSIFLIGAVLQIANVRFTRLHAHLSLGLFCLVLIVLVALPTTRTLFVYKGSPPEIPFPALAFLPIALALVLLPFLGYQLRQTSSAIDGTFGNLSYPLYCIHWLPRSWFYTQGGWSLPFLTSLGLWLVSVLASLALGYALLVMIDRPIDRMRKRLMAHWKHQTL